MASCHVNTFERYQKVERRVVFRKNSIRLFANQDISADLSLFRLTADDLKLV
jgi:hypothetical protein